MPGIITSTIAASNGMRLRELDALLAGRGEPHVIAFAREQRLEDLTHDLFVVDDENRNHYDAWHMSCSAAVLPAHAVVRPDSAGGSERMKRVPWPTTLSQSMRALVLADDAVGDRQTEAGALADHLGGEERIVDARQVLVRNARARCRRPRR